MHEGKCTPHIIMQVYTNTQLGYMSVSFGVTFITDSYCWYNRIFSIIFSVRVRYFSTHSILTLPKLMERIETSYNTWASLTDSLRLKYHFGIYW